MKLRVVGKRVLKFLEYVGNCKEEYIFLTKLIKETGLDPTTAFKIAKNLNGKLIEIINRRPMIFKVKDSDYVRKVIKGFVAYSKHLIKLLGDDDGK